MSEREYVKELAKKALKEIFDLFPLKYGEITSYYGFLKELGNRRYNEISEIGIYLSHVLKKHAFEPYSGDHENEEYPTILYVELVSAKTPEKIKAVKRKLEAIFFKDIVMPEWKEKKTWYSPKMYHTSIKSSIKHLWGERTPYYWIGEKYPEVMKYASISFDELVEGKIPKRYFDLGFIQ